MVIALVVTGCVSTPSHVYMLAELEPELKKDIIKQFKIAKNNKLLVLPHDEAMYLALVPEYAKECSTKKLLILKREYGYIGTLRTPDYAVLELSQEFHECMKLRNELWNKIAYKLVADEQIKLRKKLCRFIETHGTWNSTWKANIERQYKSAMSSIYLKNDEMRHNLSRAYAAAEKKNILSFYDKVNYAALTGHLLNDDQIRDAVFEFKEDHKYGFFYSQNNIRRRGEWVLKYLGLKILSTDTLKKKNATGRLQKLIALSPDDLTEPDFHQYLED